ncbi:MAG TPA: MFS transporter, partial [Solirubrobacteraceae bacterium]|nr:MFS transporter [Solirubrobacteraceae bacterium]
MTAYALAFGSLLLLGGRIGDLFGRKWTLIGGLVGFSIASAVGGAAGSFAMLVGARTAQGAFAAILAPSALALLSTTFENIDERRKAFGVYGAIAGAGGATGLLIGGVLTQAFSWRLTLFVNLAIALPVALAALWLLLNERLDERPALDLPGTATVSLGLFALVYGFSNAETHSWSDPTTIIALIASAVLLAMFVALESRARHPLLPLRILGDRARGGSYLAVGLIGAGMFGAFLFLTGANRCAPARTTRTRQTDRTSLPTRGTDRGWPRPGWGASARSAVRRPVAARPAARQAAQSRPTPPPSAPTPGTRTANPAHRARTSPTAPARPPRPRRAHRASPTP